MVATTDRREPRFVYLCDETDGANQTAALRPIRFGWRLDAANHRSLARAARVVTSLEDCVAQAHLLRRAVDRSEVTVSIRDNGAWSWTLRLDGTLLAAGPTGFPRRVECVRSFVQFQRALAVADPDRGVVRRYGPRALRGFDIDAAV